MEKIIHYQEKEKKIFEKYLRRIEAVALENEDQSLLALLKDPEKMENDFTFLLKEDGRVKSAICLNDDVLLGLFPKSKKQMNLFDLYDEIGIQDERVIQISFFGSDPADVEKGYMGRLFLFLTNSFKNVSWLVLIPESNEKAARFLWKRGYLAAKQATDFETHEGTKMVLFLNKLRRKGLASFGF